MNQKIHKFLTYFIAFVWLVNGLYCKILNGIPRHQEIVGSILGNEYASVLTKIIGFSEVFMAIWVISRIKTRFNAVTQMLIIATMNVLEFILVPDLLLWGKLNSLFAVIFIGVIYVSEFMLNRK